jgi:hypothetical protein
MKRMTRTKFVGAGIASAGAAAGIVRYPARADAILGLDAVYQRQEAPRITVAYPSAWHLYRKLITDLTAPAELFSLSNQVLTPGPSFDESGLPDVSGLPGTGLLITIFAQWLGRNGNYGPGKPISGGIGIDNLDNGMSAQGVDKRTGWFLDTDVGYLVLVWSGQSGAPLTTAEAILQSFRRI